MISKPAFIEMDGSSSVFPIAQEIVNSYSKKSTDVKISLSLSGTTNGFLKFCNGQLDINNASRKITEEEKDVCARNGVEYLELKIAYDAVVLAVNPQNDWCTSLTLEELRFIWLENDLNPQLTWADIRKNWPRKPINFFAPGKMSGTQDVFLKSLFDTSLSKVRKVNTSEDHNDIVMSISRDTFSLGYFSLPYLHSNEIFIKPVMIDDLDSTNGTGPIMPSVETIGARTYEPFQRPLFLYINKSVLQRKEYADFVTYFLMEVRNQSYALGYAPLSQSELQLELNKLEEINAMK